ncbi:hypothetical protein PHYSODRAFT_337507 [Phytophthora sojae]|uniref:Pectinesterase n=1 Tax=Phytophthora sojae (strain P6497) TaxID=1094619 RepID=G5A1D0_PHYSP|nr:hypothetical protein PHYSODRAFT_337507 [Phytophthora sojae]EGZ10729.1 hypothetical protein PHYSODRAFT_337507 [Phytophthora sojae]|eukprot:XP_009533474.1 hypothetical protein PHYSODRAFT_337507 [Phytophthora sojae]
MPPLASPGTVATDNVCNGPSARTQPPAGAIGVANIPNTTDEHTLFVFPGVYREQVFIDPLNGPLVLQGYTCDTMSYAANQVTITQAKAQRDIPMDYIGDRNYPTSTMGLAASNVKMYNLNVANTAGKIGGKVGQAVAAYVGNGTDYGFYACNFSSYQDTLCAMNGKQLYARSYIGGAVDFIFGKVATAWFEDCDIESVGKGGFNSTYLGRPWRPYSRVVFENSELSDIVRPDGWKMWNNDTNTANIFYKEFNNTGLGAATDKRVTFSGKLDKPVLITDTFGEKYTSEWWVDAKYL